MQATLYHNPLCSKSRATLALLQEAGVDVELIEYLRTPPTREALQALLQRGDLPVRALMREGDALYASLGLDDPSLSEAALLEALVAHPALFNRPVVVTARGVRVCRPPERVAEILP